MMKTARFRRGFWRQALLVGLLGVGMHESSVASAAPRLSTRVFGYIPYWTAAKKTWDYRGLTDIALFSVGASDKGTLTSTTFWRGKDARAIIDEAHK